MTQKPAKNLQKPGAAENQAAQQLQDPASAGATGSPMAVSLGGAPT